MTAKSVLGAFSLVAATVAQASIDTGESDGVIPQTLDEAKELGYVYLDVAGSSSTSTEFNSAGKWKNPDGSQADAPSADNKYFVANGGTLYTPNATGIFAFPNTPLVVAGILQSMVKTGGASTTSVERLHFVSSDSTYPTFRFYANKGPFVGTAHLDTTHQKPLRLEWGVDNNGAAQSQDFHFDFVGTSDAWIDMLIPVKRFTTAKIGRVSLNYVGDMSRYLGGINVFSNITASVKGPVALKGVKLLQDSTFKVANVSENTVGDLEFKSGATGLELQTADGQAAKLTVTNSYKQPTPIVVKLTPAVTVSAQDVTSSAFIPLLELGEGVEGSLDASTIALTGLSGADGEGRLPHITPCVTEDGKSFGCSVKEVVRLLASDTAKCSALVSAEDASGAKFWSDNLEPQAGRDYLATKTIYLPNPGTGDFVFAGDALQMDGASLYIAQTPHTSITFDDLIMVDGELRAWGGGTSRNYGSEIGKLNTQTIKGNISMLGTTVSVTAYNNCCVRIESELSGKADLTLKGLDGAQNTPKGNVELAGLNTNWLGKITLTIKTKAHKEDPSKPYPATPSLEQYTTLFITDERNLGGRLDAFAYNALTVNQMCMLATYTDVTLTADYNRGIRIVNCGRVFVTDGQTLAVNTPITYAGELRKEGKGTLALGGKALFINGKDATAPLAGTNELQVIAGSVKPTSTNCLDGVKMTFAAGTKLVYDLDPAGEGMKEFGPVNVKEPDGTPLAMGEGVASVPVEFAGDLTKLPLETTLALGTFASDEIANAVRGKLAIVRPKGYQVALSVNANHTLVATLAHKGAVLLIK